MWEYEVIDTTTKERHFCWGYSLADALQKSGLPINGVEVLHIDYID